MMIAVDFVNVFYGPNDSTNFRADLYRLIAKADEPCRAKIKLGFPVEVWLYDWWATQGDKPTVQEVIDRCG